MAGLFRKFVNCVLEENVSSIYMYMCACVCVFDVDVKLHCTALL